MKPLKLTIDFEPTPKGVPRVRFFQGKALTYYSWKTTEAMENIRAILTEMHLKPLPPLTPLHLDVTFWRTKSKWLKKKETMPFRKPDATNLVKLIEDCICPIVVPDDAQFTTTTNRKRWSKNGHGYIEVNIEEDKL